MGRKLARGETMVGAADDCLDTVTDGVSGTRAASPPVAASTRTKLADTRANGSATRRVSC